MNEVPIDDGSRFVGSFHDNTLLCFSWPDRRVHHFEFTRVGVVLGIAGMVMIVALIGWLGGWIFFVSPRKGPSAFNAEA